MKKSSKSKAGAFWRTDWFAGLVILALALLLTGITDVTATLERRFYDFASTSNARQPSDKIAIIAIDDQSIANLGRWPWPRQKHAKLLDILAQAKVKTVVHTAFFFEPQVDPGLAYIRQIKDALGESLQEGGSNQALGELIAQAETVLDNDSALASSIQRAGNVLLPAYFTLGEPLGRPDKALPDYVLKSVVNELGGPASPAQSALYPIPQLGEAAFGIGHLNQVQDIDGAVRTESLLVNYGGASVPSIALLAAASGLNLKATDIHLNTADSSLQIGKLRIRMDESGRMLPQFYRPRDGRTPIPVDSFYDVLQGKIPATKYTDKIVIIGATAAGVGTPFPVPGNSGLTPAEIVAQTTSSILSEQFLVSPPWAGYTALAAFLLVAAYILAALPRLSAGRAAAATLVLFAVLLGLEFGMLVGASTWIQLVFPATALLLAHLGLTTKRFLVTEAGKVKSDEESAETNRMMGLALQGQGQLDMAFDRFRRVPMGDAVMDNLYNLAMDFERKRQFNKAEAVYAHMAAFDPAYKDVKAKLLRAKNLSETVMLGSGSHPGGTLLLDGGAVEKPMLGRYQVEKELGKGAMGVVYLGRDPKIGRVVAIKTMALSQEFAGEELTDARERFFREAETAGRLQHQNIVTIFDAGEEHDLAYIAMEFLKGKDLADHCREGQLLPPAQVVSIVARVAQALAYAHAQNVVHRDIKPANIMYDLATDSVKVTDFGIARITDSSKTKTGMVLGTPSFMSPEQLAGKKVDGRSDLYSLGVMLYQMLTGVLPFRGESMSELMYKIANTEAADIRLIRPEIPQALADVVALSLSKRPDTRYQTGEQFAADLLAVAPQLPQGKGAAAQAATGASTAAATATVAMTPQKTVAFSSTVPSQPVPPGAATGGDATDIEI